MPNAVDSLRNRILAEYPTATVAERGRSHVKWRLPDAPDGKRRYALDTSIGSLHYEEAGQWVECNTDWVDSDLEGYTDKADRCRFRAHAKSNGTRRIYPRRDVTTEYIEFGALGAYIANKWRTFSLPARLCNLNDLTWDGNQAAVSLVTTPDGLKLTVTLKTSNAPTRFRWQVTLTGLTLDANWQLVSTTDSTVVGSLPLPTMTDSSAEPITRDVAATYAGGYIEYSADVSGLAYPIAIDPTVDVGVGTGADDGVWYGSTFASNTSGGSWGKKYSEDRNVYYRFASVDVPAGATISTAYLTFHAWYYDGTLSSIKVILYGNDADDAVAPVSASQANALAKTTANSGTWTPAAWSGGSYYNSPSLVDVVQEIVDRGGWASEQAMQFIGNNNGSSDGCALVPYHYEMSTPTALHIEYTEGGGGTTHEIGATVNGTASVTAAGASNLVMAATVNAAASTTAATQKTAYPAATIAGTSTTTAAALRTANLAGAVDTASTVTAAGVRTAAFAATIGSTVGVTAALTVEGTGETHEIAAVINATSAVTTSAAKHLTATATVSVTSTLAATTQKTAYPAATVNGQSAATVAAQKTAYPAADITTTSTTTAEIQRTALIGGSVTTSATVTADALRVATLAAILTTALSTSGTLTLAYAAAANIAAMSVLSASLNVTTVERTEIGTDMTPGGQMNACKSQMTPASQMTKYRSLMTAATQMRRAR